MPLETLKTVFGFDEFRPGQQEIVETLMAGENILAVMPTGAGKSMCFQIPALVKGGLTIVVSPLVALMEDQVAALKLAGVAADAINSSRERPDNVAAWRRAASGETRLLYLAPERLMTERMLTALENLPISLIAVDEAHCVSKWGPAFRPEYEALQHLKDRFPGVPIVALTATADAATREDISNKLFGGQGQTFVSGFDRPNIKLSVEMRRDWKNQLLDAIAEHQGESGIVYCLSRDKTEKTANLLAKNGINAMPYHAGMDKADRTRHQDIFMTEPGVVIVATIAFGMGIDKPDVRFVIHTDMPGSVEAYYQEIGRAGRDGLPATAQMLYGLDDLRMRRMFIDQENSAQDHKRREHKRLDALIAYCETPECRRKTLLSYFGDEGEPCGNCDTCLDPPEMEDGKEVAKKVLITSTETGQVFGAAHLIDILRGADTEKIRNFKHNKLSTYGQGSEISKDGWRSIVRQMVAANLFHLDITGHGGLSLSARGADLMQGIGGFQYRLDAVKRRTKKQRDQAKRQADAEDTETPLQPREFDLLLKLKDLRLALAQERGVPAYVIFSDRALTDMAKKAPTTLDQFAEIHGVGAKKLEDLGETFLEAIQDALEEMGEI